MAEAQVLEARVKVKVLEMVQMAVEMKAGQCFLDVLAQVDTRKLKVLEMLQESVEMKFTNVPCFLALFIFCMP